MPAPSSFAQTLDLLQQIRAETHDDRDGHLAATERAVRDVADAGFAPAQFLSEEVRRALGNL